MNTVILYGPPGVGKTTIAQELVKYGFYYYEGDESLLPEAVLLNRQGKGLTPELRDRQNNLIIDKIVELSLLKKKLVIAYDFMWDRYRVMLQKRLPEAKWVLLDAPLPLIASRVQRKGHILTPEFAIQIHNAFEMSTIKHTRIASTKTVEDTVSQILKL